MKRALIVAAALLAFAAGGCKKKPAAKKQQTKVEVPKQVVTYMGVRSPDKTIDGMLALASKFLPLPIGREQLLDLLLQRAKLPRDLLEAVDTSRTFWLVGLAEGSVADKEPATIVVPIRSQDQFRKVLLKRMKVAKTEGDLTTYQPKPGSVGLVPVKLMLADKNAIIVSGAATLAATRNFVLQNLLATKPEHDLELHLQLERLSKVKGFQRQLGFLLGRVQENVERKQGSRQFAMATTDTVRGYIKTLLTARKLVLSFDVAANGLTLSVGGQAKAGGRLAKVIKRQRPGKPLGVEQLPAETWLLVADRGNPAALQEQTDLISRAIGVAIPGDEAKRAQLQKQLAPLRGLLTGDVTMAVHHGANAKAMAVSVIAAIVAEKQKLAGTVVAATFDMLEAELQKLAGDKQKQALTSRDFKHGTAIVGKIYRAPVKAPAQAAALLGDALELGWAVHNQQLLVAVGRDAGEELKQLIDGRKNNLTKHAAFAKALKRPDQVGLVYLSLVEMVRALAASGIEGSADFVADLKDVEVKAAPTVYWGVDAKNRSFVGSLNLPIDHFMHFKPFLSAVAKRSRPFGRPQKAD